MYFNSNSLTSDVKKIEFKQFLCSKNVHVALVSETFFKTDTYFQINGYKIFRNDDDVHRGGGTAIFVKECMKCEQVSLPSSDSFAFPTGVRLFFLNSMITFISVYVPNNVLNISHTDISRMLNVDDSVFMAGDWNARSINWNCLSNNSRGKSLQTFISRNYSRVSLFHPDEPTFVSKDQNRNPSVIDMQLCKKIMVVMKPKTYHALKSDHNPVITVINPSETYIRSDYVNFDYSKANWVIFRDILGTSLRNCNENLTNTQAIDQSISNLTEKINDAIQGSVPINGYKSSNLPFRIRQLITEKNRTRRMWNKHRNMYWKIKLKCAEKIVSHAISEFKNNKITKRLESIKPHDTKLFHETNKLIKQKVTVPPIKTSNGNILYTDQEKCNEIGCVFENIHKQNDNLGNANHTHLVNETVSNYIETNILQYGTYETNEVEVFKIISSLKNRKAAGGDDVKNKVVKNASQIFSKKLVPIFNACYKLNYFPNSWKIAKIIPIPKPNKDPSFACNNRPISLLPAFGKIFEKLIASKLRFILCEKNVIQNYQFGFRPAHSTLHALLHVTFDINKNLSEKKSCGMLLIDIEKAFDTVWTFGLLYKMIQLNFSSEIVMLIYSYLTNRKFYVSINECKSSLNEVCAGVPQGSILGPILYLIYVHDVPRSEKVKIDMFCDDTALTCSSEDVNEINSDIMNYSIEINEFFKKWKIKLNVNKTEYVIFTKKRNVINNELVYGNEVVKQSNSAKYLGMILNKNGLFNENIKNCIKKGNNAFRKLYPLLKRSSKLNVINKLTIYKLFIRPCLSYAIPVWNTVCQSEMNKIQRMQNKILRFILNVHYDPMTHRQTPNIVIHEIAGVESIRDYAGRLVLNLYSKMAVHVNPLINNMTVLNEDEFQLSSFRTILDVP